MAGRTDLAPSAMANFLIFCGSTPEKQRTLLITMIQEIQRPVKCQKLNKFTPRNRELSVKQAKDQSLACSGLRRPLRQEFRFAQMWQGTRFHKTFPGIAKELPAAGAHFSTGGVAPYVAKWFSAIALNHSCSPP